MVERNELWNVPLANDLDCNIKVSEFKLHSGCYIHFQPNTIRKGMNPIILPPAMSK